jgi:hypothetical protein
MTRRPTVYSFIGHLAGRFGCPRVIDVGLGDPGGLATLSEDFELVRVADLRADLPVGLEGAAVVCSIAEDRIEDAEALLRTLLRVAGDAAVVVVSVPASASAVLGVLEAELTGLAPALEADSVRDRSVAVLTRHDDSPVPAAFSAVAFVSTFNEADIIASTIEHLDREGIGVYLIDNWSTDGTWEVAQGIGLIGAERFPADGPSPHYEWRQLLGRVEELAATIRADWFIHVDADEHRESAWPGVPLRDGLWRVDARGFNAVDHTVVTFPPVDDGFQPGSDPEQYFRHFEFGRNPGHFRQIKAWRQQPARVDLASEGGHDVLFEGRRIFPLNFLSKHYPVRSQAHGERKIFSERQERWSPAERADGWHIQYDHLRTGHRFVRDPATLEPFDDFHSRYLVERLTRVGIPRPDWPPT